MTRMTPSTGNQHPREDAAGKPAPTRPIAPRAAIQRVHRPAPRVIAPVPIRPIDILTAGQSGTTKTAMDKKQSEGSEPTRPAGADPLALTAGLDEKASRPLAQPDVPTRLVLLIREPETLYAYWELSAADREHHKIGHPRGAPPLVLRMLGHSPDPRVKADVEFDLLVGSHTLNWYVTIPRGEHRWQARLGYVGTNGQLVTVCSSNTVLTPNGIHGEPAPPVELETEKEAEPEMPPREPESTPDVARAESVEEEQAGERVPEMGTDMPDMRTDMVEEESGELEAVVEHPAQPVTPVEAVLTRAVSPRPEPEPEHPTAPPTQGPSRCVGETAHDDRGLEEPSPPEQPGPESPVSPATGATVMTVTTPAPTQPPPRPAAEEIGIASGQWAPIVGPSRPSEQIIPSSEVGANGASVPSKTPVSNNRGLDIQTELIVHGRTVPGACLEVLGMPVEVRPDGTFTARLALPEGRHAISIHATGPDGQPLSSVETVVEKLTS